MTAVPTGNTYDKYGARNPVSRALVTRFLRDLERSLPLDGVAPARVLEVGVGEGEISDRLRARYPTADLVGFDLHDAELEAQWRARGQRNVVADAVAAPFTSDTFDLVLAIEVLEHLDDPRRALAEIARVARGTVVLSVPREPLWRALNLARGAYVRALGNTPGHVQHWSRRAFVELVGRYFDVVQILTPLPWTIVQARAQVRSPARP
jgi:ubiquinone/menaquinone biosynthesis C-methylase UbiE